MTKTIEDLFYDIAFFSDIVILLLFFLFIKYTKSEKGLWLIALYCLYDILTNKGLDYLAASEHYGSYMVIYNSFTFIEYCLFSIFISFHINNKLFKKIILWSSVGFGLFLLLYHTLVNRREIGVDSMPIGIETILVLLFSFYYLYEQMNDMTGDLVYDKYAFWVITGIMIYLAGSLFIYIFANYDKSAQHQYWFLTQVFYTIKNVLFAIAMIIHIKKMRNPRPKEYYPYIN